MLVADINIILLKEMFPLHKLRSEESSVLALGERFVDCGPGSDGVGVFGGGGIPPPEPRCLPPGAQHCRRCYSTIIES